jgi:hypothetical protein
MVPFTFFGSGGCIDTAEKMMATRIATNKPEKNPEMKNLFFRKPKLMLFIEMWLIGFYLWINMENQEKVGTIVQKKDKNSASFFK